MNRQFPPPWQQIKSKEPGRESRGEAKPTGRWTVGWRPNKGGRNKLHVIEKKKKLTSLLSLNVGCFFTRSLYSLMCLPACLIIQTGGLSTFSPLAALRRMGASAERDVEEGERRGEGGREGRKAQAGETRRRRARRALEEKKTIT